MPTPTGWVPCFDTEKTYHMIMTRFKFGNLKQKGLYIDETTMRMCYTHRRLLGQTALQLIAEGKKQKAINDLIDAGEYDAAVKQYGQEVRNCLGLVVSSTVSTPWQPAEIVGKDSHLVLYRG